jgi:hypothetical protein
VIIAALFIVAHVIGPFGLVATDLGDFVEHTQILHRLRVCSNRIDLCEFVNEMFSSNATTYNGANSSACKEIAWQERRQFGTRLFEVLENRDRLREHVSVDGERRHQTARIDGGVRGLLLLAAVLDEIHSVVFVLDALVRQRDAHAPRARAAPIRIQNRLHLWKAKKKKKRIQLN